MKINFKASHFELSSEITDYCKDKLDGLEKLLIDDESAFVDVELGKTTEHHKQGEIFRAELNLHTAGKSFRAEAVAEDLYLAIDEAKEELLSEVKRYKKKQGAMLRRGGRMVKDFLRGVYNYKWRRK